MLCDECKKNLASVHLAKIVNNEMSKAHLCEDCARSHSVSFDIDPSNPFATLPELLLTILNSMEVAEDPAMRESPERCLSCGSSFNDLRETGRFGCPDCYKTFEEQIKPLLKRIHGELEHRGHIPKSASGKVQAQIELRNLKKQLQDCIKNENYEEAALLRDKIKDTEKIMEKINK